MSNGRTERNAVAHEHERNLLSIIRNTASLMSRFYSQSIHTQNLAFEAGESHVILEIHEWMLGKMQEGRMISVADILEYLQAKMDSLSGLPRQAANGSGQNSASPGMAASSFALLEQGSYPGMGASSSVGMAASSVATLEQGGYPGMGASSPVGMAASSAAPLDQGCYQGMESMQMEDCSFGPHDENSAQMAAHLFGPEDLSNYLEMTGGCASAPRGQNSYPDAQIGGM